MKKGETGTIITFKPDRSIFAQTEFNFDTVVKHLRNQAYLTKGIRIDIEDVREVKGTPPLRVVLGSASAVKLNVNDRDLELPAANVQDDVAKFVVRPDGTLE